MITTHCEDKEIRLLPAGVSPNDSSIEFVGVKDTKTTLWLQRGNAHYFKDLPVEAFQLLEKEYLDSPKAIDFITNLSDQIKNDFNRQVEIFTYYMFGDLDTTPDIKNGTLSPAENFRDRRDCPSLLWNKKNITIDDQPLTERELMIIDMISDDYPDKAIASALCIAESTFNGIKKILFNKTGTTNKVALLKKAMEQKVV